MIVVSSYPTFAERHGPKAQRDWLVKEQGYSRADANAAQFECHSDCPTTLVKCFGIVLMDEAHALKDDKTHANLAIQWIKAQKHAMATVTLVPNGYKDFSGFLSFIESPEADTWWSAENCRRMDFNPRKSNPFEVAFDSQRTRMMELSVEW